MKMLRHLTPYLLCAFPLFVGAHEQGKARMMHGNVETGRHAFIANQGQWSGPFAYKAELGALALFMEQGALTWSLLQPDFAEVLHDASHDNSEPVLAGHAWKVHFENAQRAEMQTGATAPYRHNYFLGSDRSSWRPNVPLHEEVTYAGLWRGVDMRVYLHEGNFKYDLVLGSGADVGSIGLRYDGVDGLRIDDAGRLVFNTTVGPIVEDSPVAWYADALGGPVDVQYTLRGNVLGFDMKGADRRRPIIIDPTLIAATLSGSTSTNYGHCATYDSEGNIYTGAISFGQGYPTNSGSFQQPFGGGNTDIAVSKLNQTGTDLLYSTYVGGSGGEYPHSLIVDDEFNLWIYGSSNSTNYPVTFGVVGPTLVGAVDIVVTKVAPMGSELVGSTYIGGDGNDGRNNLVGGGYEQYRGEIVLDNSGNAYIASCTVSNNFPVSADAYQGTLSGGQDGVVFSLDPTLTILRFSTHLGGQLGDMAYGLKVRNDGVVVVSGGTASSDFPVTSGVVQPTNAGGNDAFVAMLDANGSSLMTSTYWGTSGGNVAYFIELDQAENVYIYGVAQGGVPIEPSGTYGVAGGGNFLAGFNSDLTSMLFTTCIGPGSVTPVAFLVDFCNNIYISGYSAPGGLPLTPDALYTSGGFYLAVFQPQMSDLLYGTYYVGANHVDGGTSRFDKNGVVYQGVCTSGGLPLTQDAFGTTQGSWDIGVFKIDMEQAGVQANISSSSSFGCVPATINLTASGNAPNYIWDPGDGSPLIIGSTFTHTYTQAGSYSVMLVGWDDSACNSSDTAYFNLPIYDPVQLVATFSAQPISSCDGYGVQLTNTSSGGSSVLWTYGDGTSSAQVDPLHPYQTPGSYEVTLTVNGVFCETSGSVTQTVVVPPALTTLELESPAVICDGGSIALTAPGGFTSYSWSTGATTQNITVTNVGDYVLNVTLGVCTASDTIMVLEAPGPAPLSDLSICPRQVVRIAPTFEVGSILWNTGSTTNEISVDEAGTYWFTATDVLGCIVSDTVDVHVLPDTEGVGFIPNVFTPNSDGKNDRFQVDGLGLQQFNMEVYNRWGQVMFNTSNVQNGWNGGLDNSSNVVPDGTYYYIITYRDLCSQESDTKKVGHVTLLR